MRVSHLFGTTLREVTAFESASHRLLLRAGYVRQVAAGIFALLPLGHRAAAKVEQVVREEIDAIGGQELSMPVVHPAEPWKLSGRWDAIDETLVRFRDRRGHDMVLAMTHEEIVAFLAATDVTSYRQLPQLIYQFQTKFRDEARPRAGLLRVREFTMKDSYSLDVDEDGLRAQYAAHYHAYFRIAARAGLPVVAVASDVGIMGGRVAHEFMYVTPIGEDTLVICEHCGYSANAEVAAYVRRERDETEQPAERRATPETTTIEDVARLLGEPPERILKTVAYVAELEGRRAVVVAVVPGDRNVNETALAHAVAARELRAATQADVDGTGLVLGYASPVGIDAERVIVVADPEVAAMRDAVAGANAPGEHVVHTSYGRDFTASVVAGIASAYEGAPCAQCGEPLTIARGVEVGNIFQLGTRYSSALGAAYTDADGRSQDIVMGSYGIGVGRLLACVAEEHNDELGLRLPVSVAPYDVTLVSLGSKEPVTAAAQRVYSALRAAGIDVLWDDRDARPGVKFADADLRGMPIRITVSERTVAAQQCELQDRATRESTLVEEARVVAVVRERLDAMAAALLDAASRATVWPAT